MMQKVVSTSLPETEVFAKQLVHSLTPTETHATIICLTGELGSGKTAFTQAAAKVFGVKETVTSPTFVIQKVYDISYRQFTKLFHIDAYRLESGKELLSLHWEEIYSDPHNIIFIEWPERMKDILPDDTHKLSFIFIDEHTREITLT